jgi:hypothetical protein
MPWNGFPDWEDRRAEAGLALPPMVTSLLELTQVNRRTDAFNESQHHRHP